MINQLNMFSIEKDDSERAKAFLEYVIENNITINIPCLLAYEKDTVYRSVENLEKQIKNEVEAVNKYFHKHRYFFKGFKPNLMFFVFPIEDVEGLRGDEGFYEGLC